MTSQTIENEVSGFHIIMQLLQTVDVGLILIDRNHDVQMWNSFMENHSGIRATKARGCDLFELFPELPEAWLKKKVDSVFSLGSRAYSTWEQQPRLFDFKSTRPLTGKSELMYQNVTLIPLSGTDKKVSQVCLLVYDVTEIATSKLELEDAYISLEKLSRTDRLSGLNNRGYWEECLAQEFRRCQRSGNESSLILFDIDHFKPVNDTHGHQAGDEVIRNVSGILRQTQRETDISGRYGGEEFAIILPDTSGEQALTMAERLRTQIAATETHCPDISLKVTVSLGICTTDNSLDSHNKWIECADKALYQAKKNGRNQSYVSAGKSTS